MGPQVGRVTPRGRGPRCEVRRAEDARHIHFNDCNPHFFSATIHTAGFSHFMPCASATAG